MTRYEWQQLGCMAAALAAIVLAAIGVWVVVGWFS